MNISMVKRIPLNTSVTVTTDKDEKCAGLLTEIGDDYIVLGDMDFVLDTDAIKGIQKLRNQPDAVESVDATSEPTNPVEKLAEIEQRFESEINHAKMQLKVPDFKFPANELHGWQDTSAFATWQTIQRLHDEATNGDYSSPKSNKIEKAILKLKSLAVQFQHSTTLMRYLSYFRSLTGACNWNEALEYYQPFAIESEQASNWFDMAVCALKLNKEELACYSLERFFDEGNMSEELSAWYVYVNLLLRFNNLSAFREVCKTAKESVKEEGVKVLLETALYLLTKQNETDRATRILQRWMIGESEESLLDEACSRFDGNSTKPYQDFLTAFIEEMMSREKKPVAKNLKPREYAPIEKPRGITTIKGEPQPKLARNETIEEKKLYDNAKRAADSGAPEKAKELFKEVIKKGIRVETAYKDLANVYFRLGEANEAVKILADERIRGNAKNQSSWDRLLIQAYGHADAYEKMVPLLKQAIEDTREPQKQAQLRQQIADAYMKLGEYEKATEQLRKVSKLSPENATTRKRIVWCLAKQKKYSLAMDILKELQVSSRHTDPDVSELFTAITEAEAGRENNLDNIIARGIESELLYFSGELDEFPRFFLDRCRLADVVQAGRVNDDGNYVGSKKNSEDDISDLVGIANKHQVRRPIARSEYYLLAARILSDLGDYGSKFYRYLCSSFASRGDAAVAKDLDAARTWYCEALTAYDQAVDIGGEVPEQDAVISIVRYLYSALGSNAIPLKLGITLDEINDAAKRVISEKKNTAFDGISYLLCHSDYAKEKVLEVLFEDTNLRQPAMDYLKINRVATPGTITNLHDFRQLWYTLCRTKFNRLDEISKQLQTFRDFEFTKTWLEDNVQHINSIVPKLYLELDRRHVGELRQILETSLKLVAQATAEGNVDLCQQLDHVCSVELNSIREQPTKLSVTSIYPTIEVIRRKAEEHRKWIHENRKPELTLRLPEEMTYAPVEGKIEVQIVVENAEGRMPANRVRLVTQPDDKLFTKAELLDEPQSIRGGKQVILRVRLSLTDEAELSKAFSLHVHGQYLLQGGEEEQTAPKSFSIQLDSEENFKEIDNPYRTYAQGAIVEEKKMFFGRERLIKRIAQGVRRSQSKSVLVYGQYRSGKSSVLHHVKSELQENVKENENLVILYVENIADALEEEPGDDPLYGILWAVLRSLEDALEERVKSGWAPLEFSIPTATEFYKHPYKLQYFGDIFKNLKQVLEEAGMSDPQVVLLIDEFHYIYDLILSGELKEFFMKQWKALLQNNHFSAVLVGQDVMPKFKDKFANEFGTTEDERVTYLEHDEAMRLIDEPIMIGGPGGTSRYREKAIERILDLTGSSPFYIQIICDRLVDLMNYKRTQWVTEADVEDVKDALISGERRLEDANFHIFIESGDNSNDAISKEDARAVLSDISHNSEEGSNGCPANLITCTTSSPLEHILEDLERREVVELKKQSYQIRVGLYKEWLTR